MEPTWIFDLDNTLHDAQKKIFPVVNKKINSFISRELNISTQKADKLRQNYWDKYGATLEGLIKHHKVNPNKFLEETHKIINIHELVIPMTDVKKVLSSISEKKILYTNAPINYTNKILKICQIEKFFDGIFSIEDSKFIAKPSIFSMELFLKKYKIKEGYFVDDVKENLKTAHEFGLSTIWLTNQKESPKFIDRKISQLKDLIAG